MEVALGGTPVALSTGPARIEGIDTHSRRSGAPRRGRADRFEAAAGESCARQMTRDLLAQTFLSLPTASHTGCACVTGASADTEALST